MRVERVVIREIAHIELERAVIAQVDEVAHLAVIRRLTVGRQPHELIFAVVDLEACVRGEDAVK